LGRIFDVTTFALVNVQQQNVKRLTSTREEGSSEENNGLLSLNVQHDVHLGTTVVRFLQREFNEVGGKKHALRSVKTWPKSPEIHNTENIGIGCGDGLTADSASSNFSNRRSI